MLTEGVQGFDSQPHGHVLKNIEKTKKVAVF
jgi:hypothetical protein